MKKGFESIPQFRGTPYENLSVYDVNNYVHGITSIIKSHDGKVEQKSPKVSPKVDGRPYIAFLVEDIPDKAERASLEKGLKDAGLIQQASGVKGKVMWTPEKKFTGNKDPVFRGAMRLAKTKLRQMERIAKDAKKSQEASIKEPTGDPQFRGTPYENLTEISVVVYEETVQDIIKSYNQEVEIRPVKVGAESGYNAFHVAEDIPEALEKNLKDAGLVKYEAIKIGHRDVSSDGKATWRPAEVFEAGGSKPFQKAVEIRNKLMNAEPKKPTIKVGDHRVAVNVTDTYYMEPKNNKWTQVADRVSKPSTSSAAAEKPKIEIGRRGSGAESGSESTATKEPSSAATEKTKIEIGRRGSSAESGSDNTSDSDETIEPPPSSLST